MVEADQASQPTFCQWLRLDSSKLANISEETAVSHTDKLYSNTPLVAEINERWGNLWKEPFHGITTDGKVIPRLYEDQDDGIPIEDIVKAANEVLGKLTPVQLEDVKQPLDSPKRRAWSNPELYVHRFGVRLDEVHGEVDVAVLGLLKATLSPEGYDKAISTMHINAPRILNKYSYNFLIFGTPSPTEPWDWLLYGHHLCLNIFIRKSQIILTPTFTGAEPNIIDEGPFKGTSILEPEAAIGLQFMQRLPPLLQQKAQIYKQMFDPAMPESRYNPADQRHLCGAFQDNRTVPYEGVCLGDLDPSFGELVVELVEQFQLYLPAKARENRLMQVQKNVKETHFCWIGGYGDEDPFYYRLQSPVVICEFDHHAGVFLANEDAAKFHIHTIVRSPNGGDYGYALLSSGGLVMNGARDAWKMWRISSPTALPTFPACLEITNYVNALK